ncbi:MAG: GNAT family N-acetyltransferase [Actinomycetota bacterium]
MSGPPFDLGGGALLRQHRIEDLDAIWDAVEEERDRLGMWMPWMETTRTKDDERVWLARVVDAGTLDGCAIWVEGEFAGGIGLMLDSFGIVAEIGYWIRSRYEGRGLVTRACEALIDHAFDAIGLHRVVIRAGVENTRSRAIPERLGFTFEGIAREEGRGVGRFYDLAVYGLLDREWRAR